MIGEPSRFYIAIHESAFVEKPGRDLDWESFNNGFRNQDVDVMEFVNAVFQGHAYCPWMTGKRKVENFLLAQHVAVDMDCGDKRASLRDLVRHPLVQLYGAIVHETPSHTPEAPRARVIFVLDQPITDAVTYKAALQILTDFFPGADPACVDAARFFFGNGRLGQEKRLEGIWYRPDALLPVAELRRFGRILDASRKRSDEGRQRQYAPQKAADRTPTHGEQMTLAEMEDRLRRVDAYALSYDLWVKLVAAIGHAYGPGAFNVVKYWSDRPGKTPFTESKWRSLVAGHPTPAGYGTIVAILKEYGR
jgi:hypothetical protein